jgi:hypothetical protein
MTGRRLATHICKLCGWHGLMIPFDGLSLPRVLIEFAVAEYESHIAEHVEDVCATVKEADCA